MPHFCLQCGTQLVNKLIENRGREFCPRCGWINYLQLKVSAGCQIEKDGKLLLVQRGIEPFMGTWYMPAGFIEVDELPSDAAVRETMEETGFIVETTHLVGAYFYDDDPRGNGVVLIYQAEVIGGDQRVSTETQSIHFFTPDEVSRIPLAGVSAQESIQAWLESKGTNG